MPLSLWRPLVFLGFALLCVNKGSCRSFALILMYMKTVNYSNKLIIETKNISEVFKCYSDQKTLLSLRFRKNLSKTITSLILSLYFKEKSTYPNYDLLVRLSTINKFCFSWVAIRELDQAWKWCYLLTSLRLRWVKMAN